MPITKISKICCIGAGYVGGPTCAVIALKNPHINVTVVDLSESRIAAWRAADSLPIFEPGLMDVVKTARDGTDGRLPNLHFSTDVASTIREADLIMIAVNTPTKNEGLGAGSASNLSYIESAARCIAANCGSGDKIIVVKSTVPCGTGESIRGMLDVLGPKDAHFDILSNPEFLAEGTAINDLLHPDRVLIGSLRDHRSLEAAAALADIFAAWVPRSRILTINLWTSELTKLAANCMLAQRISSINSLSAICEATGADIAELSHAVGLDSRIGSKFLRSSVGFGGSCFKKDVLSLVYIAETLHLPEVAAFWRSTVDINTYQKRRFADRVIHRLHNTLWGKKIAVLGFAYKKDTGDTRESAAINVVSDLLAEKAQVAIYDPKVTAEQIFADIAAVSHLPLEQVKASVQVCSTAEAACESSSAVLVLTEWDEFKTDHVLVDLISKFPPTVSGGDSPRSDRELSNDESLSCDSSMTSHDSAIDVDDARVEKTTPRRSDSSETPRRVDWPTVAKSMQKPRLIFDGRGIINPSQLEGLGFQVESIGRS